MTEKGLTFGHLMYGDWKWVLVTIKNELIIGWWPKILVVGDKVWKKWTCNIFWKAFNELYALWPKTIETLITSDQNDELYALQQKTIKNLVTNDKNAIIGDFKRVLVVKMLATENFWSPYVWWLKMGCDRN